MNLARPTLCVEPAAEHQRKAKSKPHNSETIIWGLEHGGTYLESDWQRISALGRRNGGLENESGNESYSVDGAPVR